jgi:hypothetical protein
MPSDEMMEQTEVSRKKNTLKAPPLFPKNSLSEKLETFRAG